MIGRTILSGKYRIEEDLGGGGFGRVFRAHDLYADRTVAIKQIRIQDPEEVIRKEASVLAVLHHSNIVGFHHVDREGDSWYLVMEYVEGKNLGELIGERYQEGERLSDHEVRSILGQICDALYYAHTHPRGVIVHRDIKPTNILVRSDGVVKLVDFGIARILTETQRGSASFTASYNYVAYEVLEGGYDHRSDIYSFGVVIYEMLTGKVPWRYKGSMVELLDHYDKPPEIPEEIRTEWGEVILTCMKKNKDQRFADVMALKEAVRGGVTIRGRREEGAKEEKVDAGSEPFIPEKSKIPESEKDTIVPKIPPPKPPKKRPKKAPIKKPHKISQKEPKIVGRSKRPWMLVGALALLIALAAGGYLFYMGGQVSDVVAPLMPTKEIELVERPVIEKKVRSEPDAKERIHRDEGAIKEDKIADLLIMADILFSEDAYTTPVTPGGGNAYDLYTEVLKLDPDNWHAKEMIDEIRGIYLEWGDRHYRQKDYEKALKWYGKAREVGLEETIHNELVRKVKSKQDIEQLDSLLSALDESKREMEQASIPKKQEAEKKPEPEKEIIESKKEERQDIQSLINVLKNEDYNIREGAAKALGEKKDPRAIEALISAFTDEYSEVGDEASYSLGRIGDPAIEPLIIAIKDEESRIRGLAAQALGEIGDSRAVEPLIIAINDKDLGVRYNATCALGKIKDPRAVKPLITALDDEDTTLQGWTAEALGWQKDARAIEPLKKLLSSSKNQFVRRYARAALERITGEDFGYKIIELRKMDVKSLILALEDEDYNVREGAAKALGEKKDPRAIEALISAFTDEYSEVGDEASYSLGRIGDPAIEPLIIAIKDEESRIRGLAAQALGEIGDSRAVEPLIIAINDKDLGVRYNATCALGKIKDPRAVKPLITALDDEDTTLQGWTAEALGWQKDARAIEPLKKLLSSSKNQFVRRYARAALKKITGKDPYN